MSDSKSDKKTLTGVTLVVAEPPEESAAVSVVLAYGPDNDDAKQFDFTDWREAADKAARYAWDASIPLMDVVFVIGEDQHWIEVYTPEVSKGERLGPAMVEVEKILNRKGFETKYVAKKRWLIHRPDPPGGYNPKRGYFDPETTIRLSCSDAGVIDSALVDYNKNGPKSSLQRYLTLGGSSNMAKKEAAEAKAKERATVKKLDGSDYEISPKQQELLDEIKKRSAGGSPVGSDEERLDDPSSIAAMKLATNGVVVRHKFGARWHYFAKQSDLDKAVTAAEKAAAKKPAATESQEAAAGKKKTGALKKPSEK